MALLKKNNKETYVVKSEGLEYRKFLERYKNIISVEVTSLLVGSVVFKNPITKEVYVWSDNESKTIEIDVLFQIFSSAKNLLTDLRLAITNVYVGGEIEKQPDIKMVTKALGLETIYKNFDYDMLNIDSYIIDSDLDAFKELCNLCPKPVIEILIDRYAYLNKEGYIADSYKESVLSNVIGIKDLFMKYD